MSVPARSPGSGGWFADRPIGAKIGAVVGLLAVVVLATNFLAISRIDDMRDGQQQIYTENLQSLNALAEVQRAHAAHRVRTLEYAVSTPERRAELARQMEEKNADVQAGLDAYAPYIVSPEAMDTFSATRAQFVDLAATQLFPAADRGDLAGLALVQSEQLQPLLPVIADELEAEGVAQSEQAAARNALAADEADTAVRTLVIAALGAVVVATAAHRDRRPPHHPDGALRAAGGRGHGGRRPHRRHRCDVEGRARPDGRRAGLGAGRACARCSPRSSTRPTPSRRRRRSCRRPRRRSRPRRGRPRRSPVSWPRPRRRSRRNVQTVAAGAEQMGASIREIASNAAEASEVAAKAVVAAETTTATVAKLGRVLGGDRQRRQGDHEHRRADQPAGAQRHHRGRAGRGGRQGLRGRGQRGQGAGAGDGEGHRGHRPAGARDPGRHHGRGRGDRGDLARSSRRSPTGRPPSPRRWRSRPRRPTRCPGRCRRPPRAPPRSPPTSPASPTAADSTTQALGQTRTAVDELSRMASRPAHHRREVHLLS